MNPTSDLSSLRVVLMVPVLDFGGVESRTVVQATQLHRNGTDVRVCCLDEFGAAARQLADLGVPVDTLSVDPSLRSWRAPLAIWRYLRKHRPQVLHCQTGSLTVHAMLPAAALRIPVRVAEEVGVPRRSMVGRALVPIFYRFATDIVGVSNAVSDHLIDEDRAPRAKVVTIYNTIDPSFFNATTPDQNVRPVQVLAVGRLTHLKGYEFLIRAARLLRDREFDFQLRVVGSGELGSELTALVHLLELEDTVRLDGYSDRVRSTLERAQIFVLSSLSEGLPLALVEAMAVGLPVVATNVGGVAEVLGPDASKSLVAPGSPEALADAIAELIAAPPEDRARIGAQFKQRAASTFGAEAYLSSISRLYANALGRTR